MAWKIVTVDLFLFLFLLIPVHHTSTSFVIFSTSNFKNSNSRHRYFGCSATSTNDRPNKNKRIKSETKKDGVDTMSLVKTLDSKIDRYEGRLPSKMTTNDETNNTGFVSENNNNKNDVNTIKGNNNNEDDNVIPQQQQQQQEHRFGYCGIVGAPNVGKSSTLNALLKETLCATTRRPQTTRHAILGVLSSSTKQCCLLDTPGVLPGDGAYTLQKNMMESVKGSLTDSDMLLVVTDLFSTPIPNDNVFRRVLQLSQHKPVLVVINKIDLESRVRRPTANTDSENSNKDDDDDDDDDETIGKTYTVSEAVAQWRSLLPNAIAIIPLSAIAVSNNNKSAEKENYIEEHPGISLVRQILIGNSVECDIPSMVRALGRPVEGMFHDGVKFLTNDDVDDFLPIGPPLYDEEFLSDRSVRFFCSEFIRESLLESQYLKKELPYCCEVQIEDYKDPRDDGITRIEATIFVERDGQKAIVVGKNGSVIKQIGIIARGKIERFLDGEKVFLKLHVKVNKDWRKREDQLAKFGYSN